MNVFAPVGLKAIKSKPAIIVLECVSNFIIHTTLVCFIIHTTIHPLKLKKLQV